MAVTLKQIAQEAGVSITTVANVIKGRKVSDEKRIRIQNLLDKYQYSPNMNAKSLVNASSNLIGVLYYSKTENDSHFFSIPFVSELLSGIQEEARALNKFVLVHSFSDTGDIRTLQSNWKFSGFIIAEVAEELFIPVAQEINDDIDTVFIDTVFNPEPPDFLLRKKNIKFINNDDYHEAYDIVKFLMSNGHRNIAYVVDNFTGPGTNMTNMRFQGANAAFHADGANPENQDIGKIELFGKRPKAIDELKEYSAVICEGDQMAAELNSQGCFDSGISFTGFDNANFDSYLKPKLTTVDSSNREKGRLAVKLLDSDSEQKFFKVGHKVIIRDSVSSKDG